MIIIMEPIITVSKTGEIHGRGSDPYKWVSRLTSREREIVQRQRRRELLRTGYHYGGIIIDYSTNTRRSLIQKEIDFCNEPNEYVLIRDHEADHYTQSGWKKVIYRNGRYSHREYGSYTPDKGEEGERDS